MYLSTITQKGQATIPAAIRKNLGVNPGDQIIFVKEDNKTVVKPAVSLLDMQGSVKATKKYSDAKADQAVKKLRRKEYAKQEAGS